MNSDLSLDFLRVVEQAAIACAHTMGLGDAHKSDQAAVESMREALDTVMIDGTIVIGEGERDEAPMLYIGEKVGIGAKGKFPWGTLPTVDIAVDPLEGTNLCSTGAPNAIAVLAASSKGGLLHAPDLYMEKLVVGPSAKHAVSLDAPVDENLKAIARCLEREVEDLVIVVLDRPRHEELVDNIRRTGARIRLISDGDIYGAIATASPGAGADVLFGIGGTPEGVVAAAALKCMGGEIQGRLWPRTDAERDQAIAEGYDLSAILTTDDLVQGDNCFFAATGITDGELLQGVRFETGGASTQSLVMRSRSGTVRRVSAHHPLSKIQSLTKGAR